jgi:hypothetical protein
MGIGKGSGPPSFGDYADVSAPEPVDSSFTNSFARICIRRHKLRILEEPVPYVVFIDENERATISEGESAEISVPAGRHLINVKSQNRKDFSEDLEISARAGSAIFLECNAIPRPGSRDPRLLFMIGMPPQAWISIKEVPDFTAE